MAYGLQHSVSDLLAFSRSSPESQTRPDAAGMLRDIDRLSHGIALMKASLTLPEGEIEAAFRVKLSKCADNDNVLKGLSPDEYFGLVQALICGGVAYQKKAGVHAFHLTPLVVITQNSASGEETEKKISLDHTLIFDGAHYTREQAKDTFRFIFTNYGQMNSSTDLIGGDFMRAINNGDLELAYSVRGYGIWTMTPKNFKKDYEMTADGSYHVKEGTTRFCLDVDRSFSMPVAWGSFGVRAQGTVAARTEDLPQIIAALDDVSAKRKTVQEALYQQDGKGGFVARFDIYGMDPNFRIDNYDLTPKPLPPDVRAAVTGYRGRFPQLA
jgi:hypothetical protein